MYVNEKKVFLKKQFSQCEMLTGNEEKKRKKRGGFKKNRQN